MRYFVTLFWVFVLLQMVGYVVGSMNGIGYSFSWGLYLTIPVTILVRLLPLAISNDPVDEGHH